MDLESVVVKNGFASVEEFHELVASVPLSSSKDIDRFKNWQHTDGTKAGLLREFPVLEGERSSR